MEIFLIMKRLLVGFVFLTLVTIPGISSASIIGKPANNLGLVGYWPMNDGSGTVVGDFSGNGASGAFATKGSLVPVWSAGKIGGALSFDGSDAYVVASSSALSDTVLGPATFSFWIKPGAAVDEMILSKNDGNNTAGFWIENVISVGSSGGVVGLRLVIVRASTDLRAGAASPPIGVWTHVVITYAGDLNAANVGIYYNGVLQTLTTTITGSGAQTSDFGRPLYFGLDSPDTSLGINYLTFNGLMDEVRMYKRALSAAQVVALYNSGVSRTGVSSAVLNNGSTLTSGLVGYWPMDNLDVTTSVADRSGNGNNGGFIGGSTSSAKTVGKLGQALNFNGASQVVTGLVQNSVTQYTESAWVKIPVAGSGGPIIQDRGVAGTGHSLTLGVGVNGAGAACNAVAGGLYFADDSSAIIIGNYYNAGLNDGNWHHVVGVFNSTSTSATIPAQFSMYIDGALVTPTGTCTTGSDTSPLTGLGGTKIGEHDAWTSFFTGIIDDVRIYNRVLSASEIKQLYNLGGQKMNSSSQVLTNGTTLKTGLVGLWTFDNLDTQTAITDRSGQGNNGGFVGGSTSSAKVQGKMGQAMSFDGASAFVDVPVTTSLNITGNNATVAAWFKVATSTAGSGLHRILTIPDVETAGSEKLSLFIQSDHARFIVGHNGTSDIIDFAFTDTSNWHHLVGTYDGVTERVYLDGVQQNSTNVPSPGAIDGTSNGNLQIGRFGPDWSQYFGGKVDDVRVYNRTLSAAEVKQLYNIGK